MKVVTDELALYAKPGHPERPERVLATQRRLRAQADVAIDWVEAAPAPDGPLLRVHTPAHLARLDEPRDHDANTPHYPGIAGCARRSAGAALQALALARAGEPALSLMRPPGHHALAERAMGFCYLSNAAIVAREAREELERVAVLDFDVHHGNGTEEALVDRDGLLYVSVHRSPGFPRTGLADRGANCWNFPVVPLAERAVYRDALARALDRLRAWRPELLVVSAGFDAYAGDPIGRERLEGDDFRWLGEEVRALGAPACHLLEGGYSDDLPDLVLAYLRGLTS
jgi:acetoin utilization deacetylase AcuC-like enzyme